MARGLDLSANEGPGSSALGAVARLALGPAQFVGYRMEEREFGYIHTRLAGLLNP